ncbi:hypothetical protein TRICI_004146 [Trichomonascus ciferrii]|uniref:Uncharacterized protein n=1 Tax=Trichomonascus ciferrii TaxID=44093 RepID=A0A642V1N5_9ASCO|nr:hypothetical protein TRICI_004146 [Trichomonascus ciferrii]
MVHEDDKRLLELVEQPRPGYIHFAPDEVLVGHSNFYAWNRRLEAELSKVHRAYPGFLVNGNAVVTDPKRTEELLVNLDKFLNVAIRKSVKGPPRAMIRNRDGFESLQVLRDAYGDNPSKYCIGMLKAGLASSGPNESVLERAERFEKAYRQVLSAGLSGSQIFAIMAVLSCNNDKLIHVIQHRKDIDLEAENLLEITQKIASVYPECFEDELKENEFESHENQVRASHSKRYRPRDASHRCTRCGFIGHRSSYCKLDWEAVQSYRQNREKQQDKQIDQAFAKLNH